MNTSNPLNIPSFSIYKEGKKIDTLEHCFIEKTLLNIESPPATLRAKNGKIYQCSYDKFYLTETMKNKKIVEVILSFQSHTYGDFVIIRPIGSEERYTATRSTSTAPIVNNEITGLEVSDFGPLPL